MGGLRKVSGQASSSLGTGLNYLLRILFGSDADPVPATLSGKAGYASISDTLGIMSIANGVLLIEGTAGTNNGVVSANSSGTPLAYSRSGLTCMKLVYGNQKSTNSSNIRVGLASTPLTGSEIDIGLDYGGSLIRVKEGVSVRWSFTPVSQPDKIAFISADEEGYLINRHGS